MERSFIAKRVADKAITLEKDLDQALCSYAELLSAIVQARREAGISAVVGHDQVFGRVPALGASIIAARGGAVDLHHGLEAVQRKLGIVMGAPEEKGTDDAVGRPLAVRSEREAA